MEAVAGVFKLIGRQRQAPVRPVHQVRRQRPGPWTPGPRPDGSPATTVLRQRGRQGPPLPRPGLGHHRAAPVRAPVAADPPQHPHRGTGLLLLLLTPPRPLPVLARVAGRRWTTDEHFQAAKTLAGLDEHPVRRWTSWYRWTTLAMLACTDRRRLRFFIPATSRSCL
jgi:hypothetical protein